MSDNYYLLRSLQGTARFAARCAELVQIHSPKTILLAGGVGLGKTTFTRYFVQSLPQGHLADISSPSFTLYNIYETDPPVHHFDLYRLHQGCFIEELLDSLEEQKILTIVEWPERLNTTLFPEEGLVFAWQSCDSDKDRLVRLTALGESGKVFLTEFQLRYPEHVVF